MIANIEIKSGFLAGLKIEGFTKVNLIVGENKIGKSLLLETIQNSTEDSVWLLDNYGESIHWSELHGELDAKFEISEEHNLQIFMATHSYDVIKAASEISIARGKSELSFFRLGKSVKTSDKGQSIAVKYSDIELSNLTENNFEVR